MPNRDLRAFLSLVKSEIPEELLTVDVPVERRFELPGVLARLEADNRYPVVQFNAVKDAAMPVVSNLFATRRRLALALGCPEADLNRVFRDRETRAIAPVLVKQGPVKEVVWTGGQVDVGALPVVTHNEKDAGPYITAGAMVVKDPETGVRNVGMYRHMVHDRDRIGIHLAETSHANLVFAKYRARNEPMPVAITIGMHPAFYLGVLSFVPYGVDEYSVVGGLLQEPLELVPCETVDLEVPAGAEIVVEGLIRPDARALEGPYGEYTGLYGRKEMNPVVEIRAITMRKHPCYLDIFSGHIDQQLVGGTPRLGSIFKMVQVPCPTVRDVFMAPSGCCRLTCYVSLEKRHEGEPKNAICAVFSADPFVKYAVVVDPDVDIFNDASVLNAVATRVRPERDVFVIPEAKGHPLDPTAHDGFLVTKIGIDATKPLAGYPDTIRVPGAERIDLKSYFS